MLYLIDGYNLLFTGAGRAPRDPDELEACRSELVRLLHRLHAARRGRSLVVFDCRKPFFLFGLPRRRRDGDVEIRFAPDGATADDVLKDLIRETRDAQGATVVTSDREILDAARARGMRCVKAREFWAMLASDAAGTEPARNTGVRAPGDGSRRAPQPPAPPEPPGKQAGISEGEVDYWMREFGIGKNESVE